MGNDVARPLGKSISGAPSTWRPIRILQVTFLQGLLDTPNMAYLILLGDHLLCLEVGIFLSHYPRIYALEGSMQFPQQ